MSFLYKKTLWFAAAVLLVLAFSSGLRAQGSRTHFIYIQSDQKQPFSVILNGESHTSSSAGYLIVSKLKDGDYTLVVSFPNDAFPRQAFTCPINGTDAGFALKRKDKDGNEWQLVNLQSGIALNKAENVNPDNIQVTSAGGSAGNMGGFGDMLAKTTDVAAKNNPRQRQNNPAKQGTTAQTPAGGDKGISNSTLQKEIERQPTEDLQNTYSRSDTRGVVKIGEKIENGGTTLQFAEIHNDETVDTIQLFIPAAGAPAFATATDTTNQLSEQDRKKLKEIVDSRKIANNNNPFYKGNAETETAAAPVNAAAPKETATGEEDNAQQPVADNNTANAQNREIFNSTCKNQLTDKDVEKLRKRMISKSSDEEMITVARKYIDTKCVYTAQIKALGELLLSDQSRLTFFRILYPYVYDGNQFPTLENQLLDKSYKEQFRQFINKN